MVAIGFLFSLFLLCVRLPRLCFFFVVFVAALRRGGALLVVAGAIAAATDPFSMIVGFFGSFGIFLNPAGGGLRCIPALCLPTTASA